MHTQTTLFRLVSAVAIGGLLMAPTGIVRAWAQAEATPAFDPPARVGRLAQMNGTVSFHTADETDWQPATLNYPVTSGNSFWAEPNSSADIEVGGTRIALGQTTELDIDTLDDHTLAATEPQGTVYLGAGFMPPGDRYQVQTPRGTVTITQAGRYGINAGDTDNPTLITVEEGSAQVEGPGMSVTVGPHQTAMITGTDTFEATVGPEQPDPQIAALLGPAAPPPAAGAAAPPPVVAQMTGGEDLETVGRWAPTPQYGNVWYPPVQPGWVPYREGHWGYVAPWGWTWIDDAPWGFAPFHYGRWVDIGGQWGWVPVVPEVPVAVGVVPVYAPALVSFVGFAAGVGVGLALGGASVGWVPLGPYEPYFPPYRVSRNYIRDVNVTHVTNVTNITNNQTTINNFVNAGATTVVPSSAMANSQSIARAARPVAPQQLAAARPVTQVPVRPTAATLGVTPAVARQMSIPGPAPGTAPTRPAAPGPAVQPRPPGTPATAAAGPALPTLRPHAATPVTAPATGQPPRPVAPATGPAAPAAPGGIQPARPAGAPGPVITPRAPAATATPGAHPSLPALRPPAAAGATTQTAPGGRPPGTTAPGPAITTPSGTLAPGIAARPPIPTVQHPTPTAPAAQVQHAPAPATQARIAAPHPAAPLPQVQRATPAPPPHAAPAPHPAGPQPQVQRAAPAIVQHAPPPPPQPAAPAIAQHSLAPAPHPAPVAAVHPAPAQAKKCPEGKTTC